MSHSDEYFNKTAKNPWNQVFMHNDNDGPKSEDYKISSSLKTIWSDDATNCSSNNVDPRNVAKGRPERTTEYVQFGNNVIAIEKPTRGFGTESNYDVVKNRVNNTLKGRAITSRNGVVIEKFGNENNENQCSVFPGLLPPHHPNQPIEVFLQKVQLIVRNGFLDPKILNEPISPETFELVQMLIFYVMEYSQAKSHSNKVEIEKTFYKINLIQNEIARCQLHYIQQNRVQQKILQSYSTADGFLSKQHNFTGQPLVSQYGQSNVRNQWHNIPKTDTPNQRFGQRQVDQYAQHSNAISSRNFTFLPKAKNIDKRSRCHEPNRSYLQRDGSFPTN